MHELPIVQNIVQMAEEYARQGDATQVKYIVFEVGEMTGVVPRYLHHYFPDVSKGTIVEGAELRIEEVKAIGWCRECGTNFHIHENEKRCPHCAAENYEIFQGNKLLMKQVAFI